RSPVGRKEAPHLPPSVRLRQTPRSPTLPPGQSNRSFWARRSSGVRIPPAELIMTVGPGTQIGAYQVVAAIGAGGMGEVYRARDSRLNREVALKVIRQPLADAEHLARFRREAQALAALNHPHVASIYGLDEIGGPLFLVIGVHPGP